MAESESAKPAKAVPTQSEGNPAFRMMGLPRLSRIKLPSRNWLIFLSMTGAWVTALSYDRYHKKRALRKWSNYVSHLAAEPLPGRVMPRKITIFLEAPPGDNLRPAREHFHEYVKPVLVAGAVDWEVIEGRREGEIRVELAEKIRDLRRRNGEEDSNREGDNENPEDTIRALRERVGISEWNGVQGDLVLGRHTWKEYIRGLHEGWLGPLKMPKESNEQEEAASPESDLLGIDSHPDSDATSTESPASAAEETKKPEEPKKPSTTPSYLLPASYFTSNAPSSLPSSFQPSLLLPLPHLLGIKHTPTRMYRFLTRRRLADSTGAQVAALVEANSSRPYSQSESFASPIDPDEASPSTAVPEGTVVQSGKSWEQQDLLQDEEHGWHKSAWKAPKEGEEGVERIWTEGITVDDRVGSRMRAFELEDGAVKNAETMAEEMEKKAPSAIQKIRTWVGWTEREEKGWEMGEKGDENS